MKKTILHLIYDLKRGGAETILTTTVNELSEYNNVIVTLFSDFEFDDDFKKNHKIISLNIHHFTLLPFFIFRFKRIIKHNRVDIVHSRLFWPTVLARIATPQKIPLITTVHTYVANSVEYKKKIIRWIEKVTYRFHKTIMLADSQGALDEYFSFLNLKPYKSISPYTFVDTRIFKDSHPLKYKKGETFKIITVGRLTVQKNHIYLIEAFKYLKNSNFVIDIYGMGDKYDELKQQIETTGVPINLKGRVSNIQELITQYHLFIMPSLYEGFSLAVLEAMAMGMPRMLSNAASFKEQCEDTAVYFD